MDPRTPAGYACVGWHLVYAVLVPPPPRSTSNNQNEEDNVQVWAPSVSALAPQLPAHVEVIVEDGDLAVYLTAAADDNGQSVKRRVRAEQHPGHPTVHTRKQLILLTIHRPRTAPQLRYLYSSFLSPLTLLYPSSLSPPSLLSPSSLSHTHR